MKKKTARLFLLIYILFLCACAGQTTATSFPVPNYENNNEPEQTIDISKITETREGDKYLPDWLLLFINGGIAEAEKNYIYRNSYLFIRQNTGTNFSALSKWAENFTVTQDFPRLAADRIEKRMISSATLYPDEEYGLFFEALIKKAYSVEYHGAVKEETYWIKSITELNLENPDDADGIYDFFVFVSIDRALMQNTILNMITETISTVSLTREQNVAINRLRQTFFLEF